LSEKTLAEGVGVLPAQKRLKLDVRRRFNKLEITKYATTDANVNDIQGDILTQEIAYFLQYIKRTDILFCAFAVLLVSLFIFFRD